MVKNKITGSYQHPATKLSLPIHPLLQFLPHLKERQPLSYHWSLLAGFRIPSFIGAIIPHAEAPESPDLDSTAIFQGTSESRKDEIDDLGCLFLGQVFFLGKYRDQLRFVHGVTCSRFVFKDVVY